MAAEEKSKGPVNKRPSRSKTPSTGSATSRSAKPKKAPSPEKKSAKAPKEKSPSNKKGKTGSKASSSTETEDADAEISLWTAPFTSIFYFFWASWEYLVSTVRSLFSNWIFLTLALPAALLYTYSKLHHPELYAGPVDCKKSTTGSGPLWIYELYVFETLWWLILGILSSVGLGTGLHSGIAFLFPHIMQIVFAAENCGTDIPVLYLHPCKFQCPETVKHTEASFLGLMKLVVFPAIAWGVGTAMGELPPYFVSRAASMTTGKRDEEFEKELEEAREKTDPFSKLKMVTIDITQKWGFLGVFLLAAWPNAAFDMCGMCCGFLRMPFWTFFGATVLGKGFVKTIGQSMFFICVFSGAFFKIVLVPVANLLTTIVTKVGGTIGITKLANMNVAAALTDLRAMFIRKFEMQKRYTIDEAFNTTNTSVEIGAKHVKTWYKRLDDADAVVSRIMGRWDTNGNKKLSRSEIGDLLSATDGKFSIGALDPELEGRSIGGTLWDLFLAGVVIFFCVSIINQVAQLKAEELKKKKA